MKKQILAGLPTFLKSAQRKFSISISLLMFWALAGAFASAQTGAANAPQEARRFNLVEPVTRELAGGQSHFYSIALSAGQYLSVVVEQHGIDVVVEVFGPDGEQFPGNIRRNQAQVIISRVAESTGSYRIEVRPRQLESAAGRYDIRILELRIATEKERLSQEADRLDAEMFKLYQASKYTEAQPIAKRVVELREKVLGPGHPDVAQALNRLGLFFKENGEYTKAEPPYKRALEILKKALGPEHPFVIRALNNLAVLYDDKGEYPRAEFLYEQSLAISEKILGPEHTDIAHLLNNFAAHYRKRGDFINAEKLHRRALALREKVLGRDHIEVAQSLNNLGVLCYSRMEYDNAEAFHQRALIIREKKFGEEHPLCAESLSNLAIIYADKGDHAKAESFFQRALVINEKTFGSDHPTIAQSLNNLAVLYRKQGDYPKAESLGLRALAIREKVLGAGHPLVITSLDTLARLYEAKGDIAQAVTFQSRLNTISERHLILNLAIGSERQKLRYIDVSSDESIRAISLHTHTAPDIAAARDLALTVILQRKGRALDLMTDIFAALHRSLVAQDQALLDQLQSALSQLARLVFNGPQRITLAEHQRRIKNFNEEIEKLQSQMSQRSAEFRVQPQPITLNAIQAAVPAHAALIEFFVYRPHHAKYSKREEFGAPRYVAYVLRQQGAPKWTELGEARVIDEAIAAWRRALRDPNRQDVSRLARKVDRLVMQPIRAHLGATRRVLLSPDGALNLIPFAALVDERSRFLVERYEFSYLTSGRDLLRLQVKQPGRQPALIVANPNYGEMAKEDQRIQGSHPGIASLSFPPLPATADEARVLKKVLPEAVVLLSDQATEAAIKHARGPALLHVATHGFFLPDLAPLANVRRRGVDGEILPGDLPKENPLLLSGLALAGANLHRNSPNQEDDGLLTSLESTALDLWGTKLVVLSACDTGMGEVKNGEGVYGLRRALVLAGAESQMMSLWSVSDETTTGLMAAYYQGLQLEQGRSAALRQVQLRMLKSRDRRHPFYWASFIQSGEWANLQGQR